MRGREYEAPATLSNRRKPRDMQTNLELRRVTQSLKVAEERLQTASVNYPSLNPAIRAVRKLALRVNRPARVAILGETNAGKSCLANALIGDETMPTLATANTRLPTLLRYARTPTIEVVHLDGRKSPAALSDNFSTKTIFRIEAGLPNESLRFLEIMDFPGSSDPLIQMDLASVALHGVDIAIWVTVATQAWRETERLAWMRLPSRIRRRGILAVTHRDLLASEDDFRKVSKRLSPVAEDHFGGHCLFVSQTKLQKPETSGLKQVLERLGHLRSEFEGERARKAIAISRGIATRALHRLETGAK